MSQTRLWLALALIFSIIYIPAFLFLSPTLGAGIASLVSVPAALVGWALGVRAGLAAAVLGLLLNIVMIVLNGGPSNALTLKTQVPGMVVLLLLGAAAGWVGNLTRRSKAQAQALLHEREVLRQQTERRQQVEAALRESEERFRSIYSAVGQATQALDGRFIKVNRAFCDMLGYSEEELLQLDGQTITHPEDHAGSRESMRKLIMREISHYHLEKRLRRKDGSSVTVLISASLAVDAENRPQHVLAIIQDITEQKRLEQERLDFERKLLETQKLESLGLLAGGIAHDFNNLLVAILGSAELALLDIPEGSPARPTLKQIELAATRAADLTRQLLAYAGKGRIAVQDLQLNSIVEEMPELLKSSVPKTVSLEFKPAQNLPAIKADVVQLRQVVMNLVLNAAEAIGERPGRITITTSVLSADQAAQANLPLTRAPATEHYVLLQVADDGAGMDEETRAKIFEPFFTTKFTGRGLGLAAVQGIVHAHGGVLQVESALGQGTTFHIFLPAYAGAGQVIQTPSEPTAWTGSGRLLLVDDEQTGREVICRMLEQCGFTVLVAADGRQAMALFQSQPEQLVAALIDLMMPLMRGDELLHELRQRRPDLPALLMSGYNEQALKTQLGTVERVHFVHKPFTLAELREALRLLLS